MRRGGPVQPGPQALGVNTPHAGAAGSGAPPQVRCALQLAVPTAKGSAASASAAAPSAHGPRSPCSTRQAPLAATLRTVAPRPLAPSAPVPQPLPGPPARPQPAGPPARGGRQRGSPHVRCVGWPDISCAVPPELAARLPPQLQTLASSSTGPGSLSAVTHAHISRIARGDTARPHQGQRRTWEDRAAALSARPVDDRWLQWPTAARDLVRAVFANSPFSLDSVQRMRVLCAGDIDLEQICTWMLFGVPLAHPDYWPPAFHMPNSPTTLPSQNGPGLTKALREAAYKMHIMPLPLGWESFCVHSLAAILKLNGNIRQIHNHRPGLNTVQDFVAQTTATLEAICENHRTGHVYAVLDIATYYRHLLVRPEDWGLQTFQYAVFGEEGLWFDVRMQFGARNSPEVANRLAAMLQRSFTRWLMARGLYKLAFVVVTTDDWLLGAPPHLAHGLLAALKRFLQEVGLEINDVKTILPASVVEYCGFELDSPNSCVRLTAKKIAKTLALVSKFLAAAGASSDSDWASLHGYLMHVGVVVAWGNMWVQGIRACMLAAKAKGSAICSAAALEELRWWRTNTAAFSGCRRMMGPARPVPDRSLTICTDATGLGGVGIFVHGEALWARPAATAAYFADTLGDAADSADAQLWELAALVMLVERCGERLANGGATAILWHTDSSSALAAVNKLAHRNNACLLLLRRVYGTLHRLRLVLVAEHVAGVHNVLPDALSRWQEPGMPTAFWRAADLWSATNRVRVTVKEW